MHRTTGKDGEQNLKIVDEMNGVTEAIFNKIQNTFISQHKDQFITNDSRIPNPDTPNPPEKIIMNNIISINKDIIKQVPMEGCGVREEGHDRKR